MSSGGKSLKVSEVWWNDENTPSHCHTPLSSPPASSPTPSTTSWPTSHPLTPYSLPLYFQRCVAKGAPFVFIFVRNGGKCERFSISLRTEINRVLFESLAWRETTKNMKPLDMKSETNPPNTHKSPPTPPQLPSKLWESYTVYGTFWNPRCVLTCL